MQTAGSIACQQTHSQVARSRAAELDCIASSHVLRVHAFIIMLDSGRGQVLNNLNAYHVLAWCLIASINKVSKSCIAAYAFHC